MADPTPPQYFEIDYSVGSKRKAQQAPPSEFLQITPLGAGNEVGRSCILLKYKGKTVMLDCGIHPAHNGIAALPYFDEVAPSSIDLLLITHFHLDHAAALPYYLAKTDFKGRVFMTHPTKSIYKLILQDYVKVSTIAAGETLYDENDLLASMDRIETVNYHQVVHVNGIKFWCYNAGHVLGAAMFMLEIAGVKILYTGDYSRCDDRHLTGAETPEVKPDVLIIESTYGTQTLQPINDREKRFTDLVHQIVLRGGRCLIPVFALGRAQELLLILDEYWDKHQALQSYPIYYASALARKCMAVYQTYINMMNPKIQKQFETSNPFTFNHVRYLKGFDDFHDIGPTVVFASPGMLQNGFSRQLFEEWCTDKKNGVIIPGYSVEGTLAKTITLEPNEIEAMSGNVLPLRMSVHYVTFSAHADFTETSGFVDEMQPPHVILVHGDSSEMARLNKALLKKNEGKRIQISTPRNCQTVELEFRSEKIAKTVGMLAVKPPKEGDIISGIVVVKDYSMQIMDSKDLATFTPLAAATIDQSMKIPFKKAIDCLQAMLSQIYDISEVTASTSKVRGKNKTGNERVHEEVIHELSIYGCVKIILHSEYEYLTLEWTSNPVNDMIADSVISIILTIESKTTQGIAKAMHSASLHKSSFHFRNPLSHNHNIDNDEKCSEIVFKPNSHLQQILEYRYGSNVRFDSKTNSFRISFDSHFASVDNSSLEVTCDDSKLKQCLVYIISCCKSVLEPITPVAKEMRRVPITEIESETQTQSAAQTSSSSSVTSTTLSLSASMREDLQLAARSGQSIGMETSDEVFVPEKPSGKTESSSVKEEPT